LKIISGGQTGVDRAALDAAIATSLVYGGSVPAGRMAEDGPIDLSYAMLSEMPHGTYRDRTEKNVEDADATLIFTRGKPTNGTAYTIAWAKKLRKHSLVVNLESTDGAGAIEKVAAWITLTRPHVLNVAGPRESKSPGIYVQVLHILMAVFQKIANEFHR
jgi:hypothetical protein